ncbi:unnamed protein product [Orchesella dallaii]|uniref:BAH domain-containing protein n=1 Tax=Orchesella dallaii TaxID=48710 RepID=A0ABP1PRX4_9HEXA
MSEIERKSGLLDDITTTTATVAAVISSALETAAATDEDSSIQHNDEQTTNSSVSFSHTNIRVPQEAEESSSPINQEEQFVGNNNNNKLFSLEEHHQKEQAEVDYLGRRKGDESLVSGEAEEDVEANKCSSRTRPFHQHHHHPKGDLNVVGGAEEGRSTDCDHHSSKLGNVDGNHVREIHEISSLSPFLSMAEKAGDYYCVSNSSSISSSSGRLIRDKSDNRETYPVSHCEEKSTDEYECSQDKTIKTDTKSSSYQQQQQTDSYQSSRVFKPSSKIIELPEKAPRLHDHSHHYHHHGHHHYRSKESKIPVGIAVAWQRLVTSTSTNPTAASAMTTKAESGSSCLPSPSSSPTSPRHSKSHVMNNSNSQQNKQVESSSAKHPSRPSSASPLSSKTKINSSGGSGSGRHHHHHHHHNHSSSISSSASSNSNNPIYASRNNSGDNNTSPSLNNSGGSSNANSANKNGYLGALVGGGGGGESSDISVGSSVNSNNNISAIGRPLSACGEASGGGGIVPFCPSAASPLSRPLPSSSVPPNLGFPTASSYQYPHRGPYIDYPYGIPISNSGSGGFAMPSSPHHHHHQQQHHNHPALVGSGNYWGLENPSVPLLSPGMPSPGASEYLQLSMQQQMQLHQQHLIATSRQSSLPLSSSSPYNPYLPFLYPHQDASLAAKNPYYDHFIHQNELLRHHHQQQQSQILLSQQHQQQQHEAFQHQQLQQQQQLHHHSHQNETGNSSSNSSGISSSVNGSNNNGSSGRTSSTNSNVSVSNVGGFDLLANNGSQPHRAIPMQVASSRTSIPLLSPSPTGGIRTSTPTSTSSSSSSSTAAATTTATVVTSCNTSITPHHDQSSSQSASASWPAASSQTTGGVELSNSYSSSYSSASSPSPSFLLLHHQQQHPHLFTSSSAALSPKSLTSSTPSPVTVHDFNSGLNVVIGNGSGEKSNNLSSASTMLAARKCATPSPISLTPRGLLSPFGSPFSPSPVPTHPANNNNNNSSVKDLVWKEEDAKIKPIPTKAHAGGGAGNGDELRTSMVNGNSGSLTTTPTSSPLLKRKQINVPTPLSSPSQKHDFKRLESLIERRDSESISPLVLIPQHSPASTTSSIGDKAMSIDELSGHHHHHHRHTSLSSSISHPDAGESSPHHLDDDDDDDNVDLHGERKIIPAFHVKLEKEGEEESIESEMKAMPSNTMRLDLHIPKVSGIGSGGGSSALSSESAITTAPATSAFELLKPTESSSSSPATTAEKQGRGSKGDTKANNKSSSKSCSEDLFKVKSNHPAESLHEMKLEKAAGESPDASGEILVKVESSVHSPISSCDVKFHSGESSAEKVDADAGKNEHGGEGGISTPPATIISSAGDHNEIERINVPESTLPFNDNYSSRNISSTSFKEKQQSIEDNIDDHQQQQQAQPSRVKDVSFTSGYSSSHDTSLPFVEDVVDHDPFKKVKSSEATSKNVKSGKDKKKKSQAKDKGKTPKSKPPSLPIKYKKSGSIKPKTEKKEKKGKLTEPKTTSEFGMKTEKKSKAAPKVEKEPPKSKSTKKKLKDKVGQQPPLSCGESLTVWKSVCDEPPTKKRKKEKDKLSSSNRLELQKVVGNEHDISINNIDKNPKKKKKEKAIITSKVKKDSDKSPSRKKKVLSDKTGIDEGDNKKKTKKERKVKIKDGEKSKKPSKKVSRSPPPYRRKSSDDQQKKKSRRKSHLDEAQKWPPVLNQSSTNPVTNNNYQFVNTTDNPNSPPFTQTATSNIVTSNYGANSGDINTSFSCSNSIGQPPQQGTATGSAMHYQSINLGDCGDQTKTSSLINSTTNPSLITQQQQPVALILHPNNYQTAPVSSCPTSQVTPSSVSCQPQVTFLIASSTTMSMPSASANTNPTPVMSENTLRIPAYIPRATSATSSSLVDNTSFVQSTNFSLTDELGGESYGGPATLTLHRDVDSVHHHQTYIQPPAITIQYHHSAPATPAGALEAASPPYGIKPEENHLNLLATVAQEFGSREDIGKRLSIDGSCNNSIIGESPPMSPQKSPYSIVQYHHPQPININGNSMISTCSTTANANSNAAVKLDSNWKSGGDIGGGSGEQHHHHPINNNSSGLSVKEGGLDGDGNKDSLLKKVQTKPEKQQKVKPVKKPKVKTANSITQPKAGKKQKRSVSDSASYSPPVVLLKIPQIATKQRISTIREEKARKQSKQTKAAHTKAIAKTVIATTVDNGESRDEKKAVVVKGEKKKRSKKDKLSKPLTKANDEKLGKLQIKSVGKPEKKAKVTKTKLEKGISSAASSTSKSSPSRKPLLSPLKLQMPTTTSGHITLTATIITTSTTSTTSPVKEKVSKSPGTSTCFYNPPERISAFAKQAIARRDSTSATSPTKQPLSSSGSSSNESPFKYSMFFPNTTKTTSQSTNNINPTVELQSQQLLSSLKIPPLSSSDLLKTISDQSPPTKLTQASLSVPKVDKVQIKLPTSTATRPSSSSPSSISELKGLVREPTHPIEQDKKKTELLLDRSPTSSYGNTTTSTTSNGKPNGRVKKEMKEERKKKEKKDKKLPKPLKLSLVKVVGINDGDDIVDDNQLRKGKKRKRREISTDGELVPKKPRKKRAERSKSFSTAPGQTLVSNITPSYSTPPIITITPSSATPTAAPSSQFSLTSSSAVVTGSINRQFSPLTPPLTAKSSLGEEDDRGKHSFPSSIASCSASSTGSSRHSSPSHLGEAETENENENDFSNWVADPMFAVSAIKITSSNQPSDISSNGGDDSSVNLDVESVGEERTPKERKKGSSNKPPKLTLMSVSNNNKPESNHNMVMSNAHPSDKFHEAQSQLKSFVQFKPKQLSSGKSQKGSRHHHIKPSLKAEPVLRSQTEDEEEDERAGKSDDDNNDDFELDMEVANITTQNTPKTHKQRKASGGSASVSSVCNSSGKRDGGAASTSSSTEAATSSASAGKKPSINRNSLSYLSNSSSKQHSHPSTKEIMTKVFSRKVSPELRRERDGSNSNSGLLASSSAGGKERKQRYPSKKLSKSSSSSTLYSQQGTEMDADDEDEDELLDIDDPPIAPVKQAAVSMSAAAAAVIVNTTANATTSSSSSATATTSTSIPTTSLPPSKKSSPKKRSARSSTTSSSASLSTEKVQSRSSSSRGNRGQLSFSSPSSTTNTNQSGEGSQQNQEKDETLLPGKVELGSVDELVDEMRILTEIQGLFYTGRLNALQPPDVYGVTLDNERGAPPHLIFSAEEVLEKCLREKKPQTLTSGLRICAYWSPQYSGLYPGRVSSDFTPKFDPEKDLIPIEFDDGDTGMIKLKEIRLLSSNHPVREYDPNPLLTLEKKHRKRRHSSATGTSGGCTGDHDEPDCGEPYCAKVGKMEGEEDEEEDDDDGGLPIAHHSSSKMLYWTWSGLGYKRPKCKKSRNKEFFHGIQRGNEAINVGDAALFISTGNERPFIGRVERFWEQKGKKMVNVRWFYHPEEVKASAKRLSNLKYPGALFESPHIDENDVQTIAKKCDVLPFPEFKKRLSPTSGGSPRLAKLTAKTSTKPRDMYYVAGFYDPYTYNLTLKDLK